MSSSVSQQNSQPPAFWESVIPKELMEVFGDCPSLAGEDFDEYLNQAAHVSSALDPADRLDWIAVREITLLIIEGERWRATVRERWEEAEETGVREFLATARMPSGVDEADTISPGTIIGPDEAARLASGWARVQAPERRIVEEILKRTGFTNSVTWRARGIARHVADIERMEGIIERLERRRDRLVRTVESRKHWRPVSTVRARPRVPLRSVMA